MQICQNRPLRLNSLYPAENTLQMSMRRVRLITKRIDDKQIQPFQMGETLLRQLDHVITVSDVVHAKPQASHATVVLVERQD